MPAERITMRKVREILRLKFGPGMPHKAIARSLGIAASTVRMTLERATGAGLTWPLPDDLSDAVLEERLYGRAGTKQGHRRRAEPDWATIHRELKRKHVTLAILWEEYIAQHPDGYRYSRFCDLYRSWEGKLSLTMRQSHIVELARSYGRYGYRRIHALVVRAGGDISLSAVERVWRREGLKVPKRQPKRRRLWLNDGSCIRLRPERPGHVWSYDFVEDITWNGSKRCAEALVDSERVPVL